MSITARLATACPLDCPDTCSLEVTVEDGRLVAIDAGPANPLTQGFICAKVKHHARRVYAPERVLTPLVRVGAKGAGDFRSATWDEALDLVASAGLGRDRARRSLVGRPLPVQLVCRVARRRGSHLADVRRARCGPGAAHDLRGDRWRGLAVDVRGDARGRSVGRGAQQVRDRVGREPRDLEHPLPPARAAGSRSGRAARRRRSPSHRDGAPRRPASRLAARHRRRVGARHGASSRSQRADRPIVRRRARDRSRRADRRLGRVDAVAHRGRDRRRRGWHRRLRRGARDDPSRVRAHRVGDRAEPQRWRVVSRRCSRCRC